MKCRCIEIQEAIRQEQRLKTEIIKNEGNDFDCILIGNQAEKMINASFASYRSDRQELIGVKTEGKRRDLKTAIYNLEAALEENLKELTRRRCQMEDEDKQYHIEETRRREAAERAKREAEKKAKKGEKHYDTD